MSMDTEWQRTFRRRMSTFEARQSRATNEVTVSIKIRVASGCFHREHSSEAYALIDCQLSTHEGLFEEIGFEEHESGPELLVYLAVATAGVSLAASVINLIIAILNARTKGIKKGDKPAEPLELIVRRVDNGREIREETVLRIGHSDVIDPKLIEQQVNQALQRLVEERIEKDS
jgi:hypothetical protein